jgi:hypothetical protein
MPFKRRGAREPSPDPTTLWAVFQEDLFMSESSVTEESKKKSRFFGKKEKVETVTETRESGNQPALRADELTEEKKKSRFGKKEKVQTETEARESGNQPAVRADEREEVEAETGRKKGKDRRQQFEGPQAKVVFHHFTADFAEDVLKVEGENTVPSLNSELDVLIKIEV